MEKLCFAIASPDEVGWIACQRCLRAGAPVSRFFLLCSLNNQNLKVLSVFNYSRLSPRKIPHCFQLWKSVLQCPHHHLNSSRPEQTTHFLGGWPASLHLHFHRLSKLFPIRDFFEGARARMGGSKQATRSIERGSGLDGVWT